MMSIEDKYGITYFGNKRRYIENLFERDYNLEGSFPAYFRLNKDEFYDNSWGAMLVQIINYLIDESNISIEKLLSFNVAWSKTTIFDTKTSKVLMVKLKNDIYFNVNHTSLHSCWLLQDLLGFFEIDLKKCELIIRRAPVSEPEEVRIYFKNMLKKGFRNYLINDLNKNEEIAESIIKNVDILDKHFSKFSSSFISLYLFDDFAVYKGYEDKFLNSYLAKFDFTEEVLEKFKKILSYHSRFMYKIFK